MLALDPIICSFFSVSCPSLYLLTLNIIYFPSFVNYFGSPFKSYEPWDKNLIPNFLLSVQIQNFWWEPEEF